VCGAAVTKPRAPSAGLIGYVLRGIDKAPRWLCGDRPAAGAAGSIRTCCAAGLSWAASAGCSRSPPTGFLPSEDQGCGVLAKSSCRKGALAQSHRRGGQALSRRSSSNTPGVANVTSGAGLQPPRRPREIKQARFLILTLKAVRGIARARLCRRDGHHHQAAARIPGYPGGETSFAYNLPPIIGPGNRQPASSTSS